MPQNVLIMMADEHLREATGCYGSPTVQTPNLDRLAARGTRFTEATTPSPICCPARASLATGLYVHQHRFWSNAIPYDGSIKSWAHRLGDNGYRVESIGKLHYRHAEDPNGFQREILPVHVRNGIGWVHGLQRKPLIPLDSTSDFSRQIGPGESGYTRYDRQVCQAAVEWIDGTATRQDTNPWALFVSFATPHYPLICPEAFYQRYPIDRIDPPRLNRTGEVSNHPVLEQLRDYLGYDAQFDDRTRLIARASYYGLCSFMDDLVGQVLDALDASGQKDNTLVIYTSDHGECIGNHGIWTKLCMYEESVAIPMIIAGPAIAQDQSVDTPVSLIDIYPTILEAAGLDPDAHDNQRAGCALQKIVRGHQPERTLLSEYHDGGSITGMFMIRHAKWKYIYYPGYAPQLFNLANDPQEAHDLGSDPQYADVIGECHQMLVGIVDPDEVNDNAFSDQALRIEELGGIKAILETPDFDYTPI